MVFHPDGWNVGCRLLQLHFSHTPSCKLLVNSFSCTLSRILLLVYFSLWTNIPFEENSCLGNKSAAYESWTFSSLEKLESFEIFWCELIPILFVEVNPYFTKWESSRRSFVEVEFCREIFCNLQTVARINHVSAEETLLDSSYLGRRHFSEEYRFLRKIQRHSWDIFPLVIHGLMRPTLVRLYSLSLQHFVFLELALQWRMTLRLRIRIQAGIIELRRAVECTD